MKVILPLSVKDKLKCYVEGVDAEISGIGKIEFSEDGSECRIIEIEILTQEVSSATASLEGSSLSKFITEKTRKGESLEGWNLWWHSHDTMGVFWSGTDTGTMDGNPMGMPFMLSLVTNKSNEFHCRFDVYEPTKMHLDDLDFEIEYPKEIDDKIEEAKTTVKDAQAFLDTIEDRSYTEESEELKEFVDKDIKKHVTKKVYKCAKIKTFGGKNFRGKNFGGKPKKFNKQLEQETSIQGYEDYSGKEDVNKFEERIIKGYTRYEGYNQLEEHEIEEEARKLVEEYNGYELDILYDSQIEYNDMIIIERAIAINNENYIK